MSIDPKSLSARRFLLENPYAHIEQLVEGDLDERDELARLHGRRYLYQNPYAYVEELDDATVRSVISVTKRPKSVKEIEEFVTRIQRRLWMERSQLWSDGLPSDPVEVLDVAMAAKLAGFSYELTESLGLYTDRAERIEVAGLLDRSTSSIRISRAFAPAVRNFTAAHELGHVLMHADLEVVHRDRATDGSRLTRDNYEFEADKFATFFLMPEKLVRRAFARRFLSPSFELVEDTAFALVQKPLEEALAAIPSRRDLARILASTTHYNGQQFYSMAEYFTVSIETMAIRLIELGLVRT